ncbi:MAG: sugar-binding domain-containing protein [Eubacteriales bacterium]
MQSINLNGTWRVFCDDGHRGGFKNKHWAPVKEKRWFDAAVPGEIHNDLTKLGLIEDVYESDGVMKARWVEECVFTYRRTFTLDKEQAEKRSRLIFKGLALAAEVFVNGQSVGTHANYFCPCVLDVTGKLKEGENTLLVNLDSGIFSVHDKQIVGYPGDGDYDSRLTKRIWLRTPQCSFGWDWSQRLLNIGMHGDVLLQNTDTFFIDDLTVLNRVDDDLQKGHITVNQYISGVECDTTARLKIKTDGVELDEEITVKKGDTLISRTVEISSPRLWYPVGYGQQPLYEVDVELECGTLSYKNAKTTGLRKVRVNQDKHPKQGSYFIFEINDVKIFCKGGNFVPADMIFYNITNERYDALVDYALEANFNFLRVWGGGLYESDYFFKLCNEKGILVWQEFIFACASYPVQDITFLNNVKNEAVYNIRRLANNPSLVAWCGNNELEWLTTGWSTGVQYSDYGLFHDVLPKLLKRNDPYKYYQPSSPYSPEKGDPNDNFSGDQHPWGVGIGKADFYVYRDYECRFPNEGGTLGPTSLENILRCMKPSQQYMHSFEFYLHDNMFENHMSTLESSPDELVRLHMGLEPEDMSLADYVFAGGLVHGEGLKEYVDNFRRRKYDCSAAIFWMYNDTFPVTRSWTIVDYTLNRTPAFHRTRKAMAPLGGVVVLNKDTNSYEIYAVNDTLKEVPVSVEYGVMAYSGAYPMKQSVALTLAPDSSTLVTSFSADSVGEGKGSCAYMVMEGEGFEKVYNRLILPRFKELELACPDIKIEKCDGGFTLSSRCFVWGVCLDVFGKGDYSDNFFDLYPDKPYFIKTASEKLEILNTGNDYLKRKI